MKRKVMALVLAATMVFSAVACGNNDDSQGNSGNSGNSGSTPTQAPSTPTTPPSEGATPAPTEEPKSEGEILAEKYAGFVETPMDLNGRTIRLACSVGSRYNYVQTDGQDDPDKTNEATKKVIEILKEIEKDYNCKIEVYPSVKASGEAAILDAFNAGETLYDIWDAGCSDIHTLAMIRQGVFMPMDDDSIKDIIKYDPEFGEGSNPWTTQSDYGFIDGKQWGVNFLSVNSANIIRNCLLFNKTLVEQYGLEDPYTLVKNGQWTWAKFEEMCASIKKQSDGSVYPFGSGKVNLLFPLVYLSNDAPYSKVDANGRRVMNLLSDECLQAGNWIRDMVNNGYLCLKSADGENNIVFGQTQADLQKEGAKVEPYTFANGSCVFFADLYADLEKLTQGTVESNDKFGILPFPIGPARAENFKGKEKDAYQGVTYTVDMKYIFKGVEKPEEVAAVLVAIANRTNKNNYDILETELENCLQDEESGDMFMIMYENLTSETFTNFGGITVNGKNNAIKLDTYNDQIQQLKGTPAEIYGGIQDVFQRWVDGETFAEDPREPAQ